MICLTELTPVSTGHPAWAGRLGDILRHRLMLDDSQRIEVITGGARRRRWTTEEKLRIVDETLRSGEWRMPQCPYGSGALKLNVCNDACGLEGCAQNSP